MKQINLSLKIPKGYKWLAVQPWGEITLFKKKPTICEDGVEESWDIQKDELSLIVNDLMELNKVKDWRKSVKRI